MGIKNNKIDISIIIPTYNLENYIARTINSALSQQGISFEIIVVDDRSTDNTVAIVRGINDTRITLIEQTQNGGPSAARNAGIDAANGEFIAILDGDDVIEHDRLQKCLNRAREYNADIVVDNLVTRREDDGSSAIMFDDAIFKTPSMINLEKFILGNVNFLGGYSLGYLKPLFRADFLKKNNLKYQTNIRIGEDYLLMVEALASGAKCVSEPSAGYIYTVRNTSISHRLDLNAVERIKNADSYFLNKYKLSPAELNAQKKRSKNLQRAFEFTQLVDALKNKDIIKSYKIIILNPIITFYLWRAIWVRMKRVLKNI